jgi:deoxyadenosine/deoxycytidine kinase
VSASLISIIGPPAAGKTTLAGWLAEALPARLLREDYAGNPFLEEAWLGREELLLPAQLFFLFSRLGQLHLDAWPASGAAVSDYGFCQDAIYAARNLRGEDLQVYRRLAGGVAARVKPPDLLIHLDADDAVLLERIARRGRRHEAAFTADLLLLLRRAYRDAVGASLCPTAFVDTGKVDLMEEPARSELLAEVKGALGRPVAKGRRRQRQGPWRPPPPR